MIGFFYDYAPSHTHYILEWDELQNEVDTNGTRIVLDYIDPCLTSIYQPCDVVINKPLKQKMGGFYQESIHYLNSKPGNKIHVSREKPVEIIVKSFEWINSQQMSQTYIRDSFIWCGLNPYVEDQSRFKAHLYSLSDNMSYDSLLRTKESMKLKGALDGFKDVTPRRGWHRWWIWACRCALGRVMMDVATYIYILVCLFFYSFTIFIQ